MSRSPRERIEAATLALVTERGIAGITVSSIAAKAGVSRQTVYNNYGDVESVIYAATVTHQQQSSEHLAAVLGTIDSPAARLEHLVRHSATLGDHGRHAIRGGFSDSLQQLIGEHDRAVRDLITRCLQDGKRNGDFRGSIDLETDSVLIHGMIEASAELIAAKPEAAAKIVNATVASVLATVAGG